jgi:hypothetical protein
MHRFVAALVAAIVVCGGLLAGVPVFADSPFPQVPLPPPTRQPHKAAYVCLAGGLGFMAASFVYSHQADDSYAKYLSASEPDEIQHWYDEAVRMDKVSSASLIAGEVLFAGGLYLRFLHRPSSHLELAANARRCAFSYRF